MSASALQIIATSPYHAVGEWRGHTLAVFDKTPTLQAARDVARTVERLASSRPGGSAYLAILRPLDRLPDDEIRRVYIDLGGRVNDTLNCIGVTIESEGFAAAGLRALVTGLGLAARTRFPIRCYSSLSETGAWVQSRLSGPTVSIGTEAELAAAFAQLKSELAAAR